MTYNTSQYKSGFFLIFCWGLLLTGYHVQAAEEPSMTYEAISFAKVGKETSFDIMVVDKAFAEDNAMKAAMQQYFFSKVGNTPPLPLLDGMLYQAKGQEVSTGRYHYVIRVDTGLGRWPAFVGMSVAMSGIPKEKLCGVGKVLLCTTNAENMLQLASGLFEGDTADAELPSLIGEKLVVVSPKRSSANDDANKAAKETFLKNVKGVNPNVVRAIEHDMARCWVHDFTGMGAIQKPKEKVVNNEYKGGVDFKKLLSRKVLLFVALRQGVVMRVLMPVFGVFCVALLLYDAYHRFIGQSSRQTTLRP